MQAFVLTSATEFGENNRFRFETGTTLLVLSVVVLRHGVSRLAARWRPTGLEQRLDDLGWAEEPPEHDPDSEVHQILSDPIHA